MKNFPIILLTIILGLLPSNQLFASDTTSDEIAVRQVLKQQVAAWNRHDLEQFMRGYWNSPDLTFFSGATETKGWQLTLGRYREKYQSQGSEMGSLDFSDLDIQILGPNTAFARGAFHLKMSNGKEPRGIFTLVFKKFPEGWKIIHDHTCAAE